MSEIPRVSAAWYEDAPGRVITIVMWCAHCAAYHTHGGGTDAARINEFMGHRVAHCGMRWKTSPFRETGYELSNIGQAKDWREARDMARTAVEGDNWREARRRARGASASFSKWFEDDEDLRPQTTIMRDDAEKIWLAAWEAAAGLHQ